MSGRWTLCRVPRPDAELRLYCFPHSGGSAGEFLFWSDDLPGIEVWGVQPPGWGGRAGEPPARSMTELAGAIADEAVFTPPYVLFGHSLGALTGYEVTRRLHARGAPLPECLVVSAHEAPHRHTGDPDAPDLDDEILLAHLDEHHGAVPAELRVDPEWRAVALGGLRADLRIVADYRDSGGPPLPVPIVALGGVADDIPETDLAAWAAHTTEHFTHRMFSGGHFYFREHDREFFDYLGTGIRTGTAR